MPVPVCDDQDECTMFDDIVRQNSRSGSCEDDRELTCPYIGILPDETDDEGVSPLRF